MVFGYGYSASRLGARLLARGWRVGGTHRRPGQSPSGVETLIFSGASRDPRTATAVGAATHVLVSIPPDDDGDPVLRHYGDDLEAAPELEWVGLFSTTGVYGDTGGSWVDESATLRPGTLRARRRVAQEEGWATFAEARGVPLQIFRLSGIYGPGRSPLDRVRAPDARRIVKPGSVFNRIYVDDIAGAVEAGIAHPDVTGPINVSDERPASSHEVLTAAADLLGMDPPPEVAFDDAGLSPMGRSFYAEDRRVAPARLTGELGYRLRYPTYVEGLEALRDGPPTLQGA